jgi:transposase
MVPRMTLTMLQALTPDCDVTTVIADKAYDANETRQAILDAGRKACIPSKN